MKKNSAAHRADVQFLDRRQQQYRNRPSDYSRARHRKIGPPNRWSMFDMTPDELTGAKGLGPSY